MFRLSQLSPDSVNVHDPLRRVVVSKNLCVEFTNPVCFLLCELIAGDERTDLLREAVVGFLESFCLC